MGSHVLGRSRRRHFGEGPDQPDRRWSDRGSALRAGTQGRLAARLAAFGGHPRGSRDRPALVCGDLSRNRWCFLPALGRTEFYRQAVRRRTRPRLPTRLLCSGVDGDAVARHLAADPGASGHLAAPARGTGAVLPVLGCPDMDSLRTGCDQAAPLHAADLSLPFACWPRPGRSYWAEIWSKGRPGGRGDCSCRSY